jgi:hypothetical protein
MELPSKQIRSPILHFDSRWRLAFIPARKLTIDYSRPRSRFELVAGGLFSLLLVLLLSIAVRCLAYGVRIFQARP